MLRRRYRYGRLGRALRRATTYQISIREQRNYPKNIHLRSIKLKMYVVIQNLKKIFFFFNNTLTVVAYGEPVIK